MIYCRPSFLLYAASMKLFQYWASAERSITDAEGNPLRLKKWGGSNDNADEARRSALSKLDELAQRLMVKVDLRWAGEYTYSTRDLPEELIEKIDDHSGITRNRYGCLVLNSDNLMIADIDIMPAGKILRFINMLTGNSHRNLGEADHLRNLETWLQQHPEMGVRVYRTAAGLRYLFTHAPIAPTETAFKWLKEVGSDRLYVFLCKEQQSFRARLTPKPWRCGQERPPANFYPAINEQSANAFASWLKVYAGKAQPFATCRFVASYGHAAIHPDLQKQIETHDAQTRSLSTAQLA